MWKLIVFFADVFTEISLVQPCSIISEENGICVIAVLDIGYTTQNFKIHLPASAKLVSFRPRRQGKAALLFPKRVPRPTHLVRTLSFPFFMGIRHSWRRWTSPNPSGGIWKLVKELGGSQPTANQVPALQCGPRKGAFPWDPDSVTWKAPTRFVHSSHLLHLQCFQVQLWIRAVRWVQVKKSPIFLQIY